MNMKTFIPALAVLALAAGGAAAQTPYSSPTTPPAGAAVVQPSQPQGAPATDMPVLGVAQVSPDCGDLYGLNGKAFCVMAPLVGVGDLAETYISTLESQGWLVASGESNRVVFIKRRPEGGCDGMQMIAFYDTARAAAPGAAGYLGFATIPGDICTAGAPAQ